MGEVCCGLIEGLRSLSSFYFGLFLNFWAHFLGFFGVILKLSVDYYFVVEK